MILYVLILFALVCFAFGYLRPRSEVVIMLAVFVGLLGAAVSLVTWFMAHWFPAPGTAGVIIERNDESQLALMTLLNIVTYFVPVISWRSGAWLKNKVTHRASRHRLQQMGLLAVILAAMILVPERVHAQEGLLRYAVGSSLHGGNESALEASSSELVYRLPGLGARLKNPMGVRFASFKADFETNPEQGYPSNYYIKGLPLWEIFRRTVGKPEGYTILEVVRIVKPDNPTVAVFWFSYIETKDVEPQPVQAEKPPAR